MFSFSSEVTTMAPPPCSYWECPETQWITSKPHWDQKRKKNISSTKISSMGLYFTPNFLISFTLDSTGWGQSVLQSESYKALHALFTDIHHITYWHDALTWKHNECICWVNFNYFNNWFVIKGLFAYTSKEYSHGVLCSLFSPNGVLIIHKCHSVCYQILFLLFVKCHLTLSTLIILQTLQGRAKTNKFAFFLSIVLTMVNKD